MKKSAFTFMTPDTQKHAALILDWRRKPRIAAQMKSSVDDNLEKHIQWLEIIQQRSDYFHWLIMHGQTPIGLINFNWEDDARKNATWGMYIGEEDALGFGGLTPPYLFNELFDNRGAESIHATVRHGNTEAIGLHQMFGYDIISQTPDFLELRLNKPTWQTLKKFHKFTAHFP